MITWTQEQSINFECAREVITDLISIYTAKVYLEKKKPEPDLKLIESYLTEQTRLRRERTALNALDDSAVALVRSKYSPIVRSWREERRGLVA